MVDFVQVYTEVEKKTATVYTSVKKVGYVWFTLEYNR